MVASARPTGALYVAIAMPLEIHAVRAMRIRSIFNFICKVFQNVRTQQYTYILTGLLGDLEGGALFVKIGKPYTPQNGKIVDVVGNPVIFTDFGENPMITIGFPHNL